MHAFVSLRFALAFAALFLAAQAGASDSGQDATPQASQPPLPVLLSQLTDPAGLRSRLEQQGVKFTFVYYGDAFDNPNGGIQQGPGYDARFGIIVDANLEKLAGWTGAAFHASMQQIHGTQFSTTHLDNLMLVSGVEAPPSTRLFNLWIEQQIGQQASLRFGQFTAAQEFLVSDNADLFVNSTFGWPVLNAIDLPSGGPAYPEATPGVRLQFTATKELVFRAAVFDGNPAGPGSGNPVLRDPFGVAFRVSDPPFFIVEVAYDHDQDESGKSDQNQEGQTAAATLRSKAGTTLPGTIQFGAWLNTGQFADQRLDALGGLLAQSGGAPLMHQDNGALYFTFDQMLWRIPGSTDQGLNIFWRAEVAPSERNLMDFYVDGGFTFKGMLATRPEDLIGLAFAYGRISPQAAAYYRDAALLTGTPVPLPDYEALIELTYQWKLADKWFVQPDLQYVIHPGAKLSNPFDPASISIIPNALVLGLRSVIRF